MDAHAFIAKWRHVTLTERSAAHQHFLDLCELVGHPKPAEVDPGGEFFTFERGVTKRTGKKGWADVWKRGFFAIEYKGRHKDLDAAYDQLLLYRGSLENPPLLIVCDMERTIIHTNFTGTVEKVHEIPLEGLSESRNLDILSWVFHDPGKLEPTVTREAITNEVAGRLARIAQGMRDRGLLPSAVARFLNRLVFCMFAEDVGLLPSDLFTKILDASGQEPKALAGHLGNLFAVMARGGSFGAETIRHFNGNLFDDAAVITPTPEEMARIRDAAKLDWSQVDPSIFGTLFERGLDPSKRSQLGAHYTSRADIETLIDPVIMEPLRREWAAVCQAIDERASDDAPPAKGRSRGRKGKSTPDSLVRDFLQRLQAVTVLDPACGSGNFLYVALQKLKDLEKEVLVHANDHNLGPFLPLIGPRQLRGIEVNSYAHDLAQMTIWIGYLQWQRTNGFRHFPEPVLERLDTIENKDAVLDLTNPDNPLGVAWPEAEFLVGNPPFLGGKKLRAELGDSYVDALFRAWRKQVRPEADLCCYWFETARRQIEQGKCKRAGLIATQGIRGGASRETLKRVKETGDIFFAVSDRNWVQDGAAVHISMIGFDDGRQSDRTLDGHAVGQINSDLTATSADITKARQLASNLHIAYMGDTKGGAFDITEERALNLLHAPNPHGRPNSDVVVPWINGLDVTRRLRNAWIIDFGVTPSMEEAAQFELPFEYVRTHVYPARQENKRRAYRSRWWVHVEARPAMRLRLDCSERYLVTPRVTKHRLFAWLNSPTLPDSQVFAIINADNFLFGILHSRPHESWARVQGTQVRERESGFRYTPTTCFETFPFPSPTEDQKAVIAEAARRLDELRSNWLNPPEWTRTEVLEFPGSVDGPWATYVHEPDERGIGTVRYPRTRPRNVDAAKLLARRTLTNLYNERPTWLDLAHRALDEAVFAAYGWPPDLADDDLLARLLALNLERASAGGADAPSDEVDVSE